MVTRLQIDGSTDRQFGCRRGADRLPFDVLLLHLGALVMAIGIDATLWAQPVAFVFENGTAFDDGAGVDASMVAGNGATSVTMTTVDILVPEYEEFPEDSDFVIPTGRTLSAALGDAVGANIVSNNTLGIDNPSVTNLQYNQTFGTTLNESANFNRDEAWIFDFNVDVQIVEFNFASLDDDDQFTVTVAGVFESFEFDNGTPSDDFEDPLGDLIIAAGTHITLQSTGQSIGAVRIAEISVLRLGVPGGPLVGDYNGDQKVSAADFVVWRDTLGSPVQPGGGADGDFSGLVDPPDFEVWKEQYGEPDFGASLASGIPTPEPPTAGLGMAALMMALAAWRSPCRQQNARIR